MNIFSTGPHLFLIIVVLFLWKLKFFPSNFLVSNHKTGLAWLAFMFGCSLSLYCALGKWSSPSVREDVDEVSFYLVFSLVWVVLAQNVLAFLGVSICDDVAERGNRSAGFAVFVTTIS